MQRHSSEDLDQTALKEQPNTIIKHILELKDSKKEIFYD